MVASRLLPGSQCFFLDSYEEVDNLLDRSVKEQVDVSLNRIIHYVSLFFDVPGTLILALTKEGEGERNALGNTTITYIGLSGHLFTSLAGPDYKESGRLALVGYIAYLDGIVTKVDKEKPGLFAVGSIFHLLNILYTPRDAGINNKALQIKYGIIEKSERINSRTSIFITKRF